MVSPSLVFEDERLSALRLFSLGAATSAVIWHTGADGHVGIDNPSWAAFTGQQRSQYSGLGWLEAIHHEDRDRVRATGSAAWTAPRRAGVI